MIFNRTKIICTIGPASESKATLEKMIKAGMDCVRLNFSHGSYEQFAKIIKLVREVSQKLGVEVAIIQDLQGPKIRIGDLPKEGIPTKQGDEIVLSTVKARNTIPVQYEDLAKDVHAGDTILVNDGLIELRVLKVNAAKTQITCRVEVPGLLLSNKGINVPTASISAPPMTPKDRRDVHFGIKEGVDYVALSFVKSGTEIDDLKKTLRSHRSKALVIAKVERHEAIDNLQSIVQSADAVMVARGDLGVEMAAEQVPLLQKKIIHLCNIHSKPVIVATQMLASMTDNPRATRAEISDAANAIFDHADALMLSNETAVGSYPVEATATLSRVASAVEDNLKTHRDLLRLHRPEDMPLTNATCLNASKLAHDINARYIVAVTRSGYTAREIAKYRPFIPIIVFTPDPIVARQLRLVWDVAASFVQWINITDSLPQIRETLLKNKLAKHGDEIVVCNAGFGKREKLITTTML